MTPRSPPRSGFGAEGNSPVGRHKLGNSRQLPGRVVYVCPAGEVQITVPSWSCGSPHPMARDVLELPAGYSCQGITALRYPHRQDGRDAIVAANLNANALAELAAAAEQADA